MCHKNNLITDTNFLKIKPNCKNYEFLIIFKENTELTGIKKRKKTKYVFRYGICLIKECSDNNQKCKPGIKI
jgi:hypothetical protein